MMLVGRDILQYATLVMRPNKFKLELHPPE